MNDSIDTPHSIVVNQLNNINKPEKPQLSNVDAPSDGTLGRYTGIVSAPQKSVDYQAKIESNKRKWKLKRYAEKLMPKHRTNFCMKHLGRNSESVDLYYNPTLQNAHYQGLAHCDNVWTCPVCSATISARRVAEIQSAVDQWQGATVMLTYTMSHGKNDNPLLLVEQLRNAMRDMYKDRAGQVLRKNIGWFGTITNLDVTYHDRNAFHIHIHQLVFLDNERATIDVMNDEFIQKYIEWKFAPRWIRMLEKYGATADLEHGFKCTAGEQFNREYIAKFGRLPKDTTWTIANEVAQGNAKRNSVKLSHEKGLHPFQVLELTEGKPEKKWSRVWHKFVEFTKGRNQLTWAPGLKAFFGIDDITDEQVIEAVESVTDGKHLICKLWRPLWDDILLHDLRCKLLNETIKYEGERYELEQFFIDLRKLARKNASKSETRGSPEGIFDYKTNNINIDGKLHDWGESDD